MLVAVQSSMAHSARRDSPELPDFSLLKRLARDQLIYLLEQVWAAPASCLVISYKNIKKKKTHTVHGCRLSPRKSCNSVNFNLDGHS